MGKVRRLRQKYHLACQKSEVTSSSIPLVPVVNSTTPGLPVVPVKLSNDSNLFSGVTISLNDLKQTLLPPSTIPLGTVSEASVSGSLAKHGIKQKHLPKKEKRLTRRDALLRRIDTLRTLKEEAKQRAKRQKTKVTGDMKPLMDALPTVIPRNDSKSQGINCKIKDKVKIKKKAALPKKQRKKTYLDDLKAFKSVLNNSHYKADPASAISNFIIRTIHK